MHWQVQLDAHAQKRRHGREKRLSELRNFSRGRGRESGLSPVKTLLWLRFKGKMQLAGLRHTRRLGRGDLSLALSKGDFATKNQEPRI